MARPAPKPKKIKQDLLPKAVARNVSQLRDLSTISGLQSEWARLHRGLWLGNIDQREANTLLYSMQTGVTITKIRDELLHVKEELAIKKAEAEMQHRLLNAPDLSRLDMKELEQLEALLLKAQGGEQPRITQQQPTDTDTDDEEALDDDARPKVEAHQFTDDITFDEEPEPPKRRAEPKRSAYVDKRLAAIKAGNKS